MSNNHYKILPLLFAIVTFVYVLRTDTDPSSSFLSSDFQRTLDEDTTQPNGTSKSTILQTICKDYVYNQSFPESRVHLAAEMNKYMDIFRGGNKMISIIKSMVNLEQPQPITPSEGDVQLLAVTDENRQNVAIAYAKTMTFYLLFMAFFLLASLFCLLGFCCVCINKCQKVCCCCHLANSEKGKIPCGIIALLLAVGLMGIGFLGVISAENVDGDASRAVCSMSYFLEDIIQGNLSRHWLGLTPTANQLNQMLISIDGLQAAANNMNTTFKAIDNSFNDIKAKITTSYDEFKDKTLPRVDVSQGTTYQPEFIKTYGPPTQEGTVTNAFMDETVLDLSSFIDSSNAMLSGVVPHLNSQNGLSPYIETGKNTTLKAANAVQTILNFSDDYSAQMDDVFAKSQKVLRFLYGILAAIPAYCCIWWVINFLCGCRIYFFMNFGCLLLILVSIAGWIVSIIFVPASIGLMEACGAINETLYDQALFNKSINLFLRDPQAANQYLYPCLYGDPDIPTAFGLKPPTEDFINFYKESLVHYDNIIKTANYRPEMTSVPNAISSLSSYRLAKADAPETTVDLAKLNQNSMNPTSTCEPVQDLWYLSSTQCGSDPILQSTDSSTWNAGSKACIGLNLWNSGTPKDIRSRYDALKYINDCQDTPKEDKTVAVETLVPKFIENRAALGSLLTSLTNSMSTISSAYQTFSNQIHTVADSSARVSNNLNAINNVFNNPTNGIMTNMKCKVIPEDLQVMQNTLCVGFVPTTLQFSLITIAFSFVAMLGAFSLFCLSRKMRTEEEIEKYNDPTGEKKKARNKKEFEMTATRVY